MSKIESGKFVSLIYDLYDLEPDGTRQLVHQVDPDDPEKIIYGVTRGVIVPLEVALDGLEEGAPFEVEAGADDAFGPYLEEQVMELDKDMFVVNGKFDSNIVKVGNYVPMLTADGFRINGKVVEITDDKVKLDFNHPLAGKSVCFKGTVLEVRDATPEELHMAAGHQGCGCNGGGSCGCGGSCDCESNDTCGCSGEKGSCGCGSAEESCGC